MAPIKGFHRNDHEPNEDFDRIYPIELGKHTYTLCSAVSEPHASIQAKKVHYQNVHAMTAGAACGI